MRADEKDLVGHAGTVLLRTIADRSGLTAALTTALPQGIGDPGGMTALGMSVAAKAGGLTTHGRLVLSSLGGEGKP